MFAQETNTCDYFFVWLFNSGITSHVALRRVFQRVLYSERRHSVRCGILASSIWLSVQYFVHSGQDSGPSMHTYFWRRAPRIGLINTQLTDACLSTCIQSEMTSGEAGAWSWYWLADTVFLFHIRICSSTYECFPLHLTRSGERARRLLWRNILGDGWMVRLPEHCCANDKKSVHICE